MKRTFILFLLALCGACATGAASGESASPAAPTAPAKENAALVDLTPENSVLVYVDFNTGLDNLVTTVPGTQYMNNVRAFAAIGQAFDMPIAIFGEENDFYGPFYPEVKELETKSKRFLRTTPTGYTPEFAAWLKSLGRKNVIIGGLSIDNCTMHTSLDLRRAGYNVFFMPDVSPTNNPSAYSSAITRLVQAGALPQTWVSIATDLIGDWNSEAGRKIMPVMQAHLRGATVGETLDPTPDGKGF